MHSLSECFFWAGRAQAHSRSRVKITTCERRFAFRILISFQWGFFLSYDFATHIGHNCHTHTTCTRSEIQWMEKNRSGSNDRPMCVTLQINQITNSLENWFVCGWWLRACANWWKFLKKSIYHSICDILWYNAHSLWLRFKWTLRFFPQRKSAWCVWKGTYKRTVRQTQKYVCMVRYYATHFQLINIIFSSMQIVSKSTLNWSKLSRRLLNCATFNGPQFKRSFMIKISIYHYFYYFWRLVDIPLRFADVFGFAIGLGYDACWLVVVYLEILDFSAWMVKTNRSNLSTARQCVTRSIAPRYDHKDRNVNWFNFKGNSIYGHLIHSHLKLRQYFFSFVCFTSTKN